MNNTRRGFALLIINSFQNDDGFAKDLVDLEKLLAGKLNFEVIIEKDKTVAQIKELLKSHATHKENEDSDCFLCVISSHGDNEDIVGSDKKILDVFPR